MEQLLEQIRNFKEFCKENISEDEEIIDVSYYGKITLSKNDADISNEKKEDLYLVKKEHDGKTVLEFYTNVGIIAKANENGQIEITTTYKDLINEKEFLLQLQNVMPMSLKKLEEIVKNKQEKYLSEQKVKESTQEQKDIQEENEEASNTKKDEDRRIYKPNAKDVKIDMNKKITKTKSFSDLVPEVHEKGIQEIIVRRKDNTQFEFIGINEFGEEIELNTLSMTEGTNPNKDIINVSGDGKKVEENQVMTILKIENGENEGKQNEGFTVTLGTYGTPEINYYRRSKQTNEYTSIPVNLINTNQKITDLDVREYMEKQTNTNVEDNIKRAKDRIENNENKETVLENIDDDPYNDKLVDSSEMQIRKAAKRCKISVEAFKMELEKQEGDSLEEKIENAEEQINEEFRGTTRQRA